MKQIVARIAKDSRQASLAWLDQTEALFRLLATQPKIGQRRRTRRSKTIRQHTHGNYVVYYRPVTGGIEIMRVLHGARNPRGLV